MAFRQKRKAVYIPERYWNIMKIDADARLHSVTIELKNVLYDMYEHRVGDRKVNKKIPSTETNSYTAATGGMEDKDIENKVF